MKLNRMSYDEKSRLLIELCGFNDKSSGNYIACLPELNLYAAANMAMAWRVLNWAHDNQSILSDWGMDDYQEYFFDMWELTPAEAQTKWLDEILELAIKAGMVKR